MKKTSLKEIEVVKNPFNSNLIGEDGPVEEVKIAATDINASKGPRSHEFSSQPDHHDRTHSGTLLEIIKEESSEIPEPTEPTMLTHDK